MSSKPQPIAAQPVEVVEADVFDRMSETRELIAQRAYEVYESRDGDHGFDQDDWLKAEGELIPKIEIDYQVGDDEVDLIAKVPGFNARDLEVVVGHRRAVLCGIHPSSNVSRDGHHKNKKVMRVIELPFEVDPISVKATLLNGTLQVLLPRLL